MRYIQSYNESKNNGVQSVLEQLAKIDTTNLRKYIKPFQPQLAKLKEKYSTNGVIDESLIRRDLKLNESKSSMFSGLSSILDMPREIIGTIIDMFKGLINHLLTKFWSCTTLVVAVVIFVLSMCVYQAVEHEMNGISVGIVNTEVEFVPEHVVEHKSTYRDSDGKEHETITYETIPDTWNMDVRASNGRIEAWTTTDKPTGAFLFINSPSE